LPRTDDLNLVTAEGQSFRQAGQGHGDAIHLRRIGLGDKGEFHEPNRTDLDRNDTVRNRIGGLGLLRTGHKKPPAGKAEGKFENR
jgi:hypothetical protein